jgi:hypothetical protein
MVEGERGSVQDGTSDVMTEEMCVDVCDLKQEVRGDSVFLQFGFWIKLKADLIEELTLIELARMRAGAATWNLN